ncbi:MAG: hypothetical protein QOE70_6204 [Chthoniobacter sp.]|jgi:hypothetical protein|nr:hypothetical protein [Chthoniobacter sp.]
MRSFLLLFLVLFLFGLHLPVSAQMLGKLEDYPELFIAIHYQLPDGSANEGMQLSWRTSEHGFLKVKGTVHPIKQPMIDFDMPMAVVAPIFEKARDLSGLFRLQPPANWPSKVTNEMFNLSVSHSGLKTGFYLIIRRTNPDAWTAAAKLWNDLRTSMPPANRESIHERN